MRHLNKLGMSVGASVERAAAVEAGLLLSSVYRFELIGADGELKWQEEIHNLITFEGLNDVLSKYFKGSSYTAAFYVGLVDNDTFGSIAQNDTAAQIVSDPTLIAASPSPNQWAESTAYSQSTRPALTLGSVASQSVDNSSSKASFTINASKTIKGAFVDTVSTKGGTTGVLYGAAAFTNARVVESGDTLNVTITLNDATG